MKKKDTVVSTNHKTEFRMTMGDIIKAKAGVDIDNHVSITVCMKRMLPHAQPVFLALEAGSVIDVEVEWKEKSK
jgi:hypothetical protein